MRAAVVTSFDQPPACDEFTTPVPAGPDEMVVEVVAAGLHPRVRSQAAGSHYTSTAVLPLIPGIDGVGRGDDGVLRYFVLPDTERGSMAERVVIDARRSIELPDDADAVQLAAAMNPAMSSWIALRQRVGFAPGQRVLVLGATGNAGQLAVQVAAHLGAAHVTAVGREAGRLAALTACGADRLVVADDAVGLASAASDVDVVLDFVWGPSTADAIRAITPHRRDDAQRLAWVQIGSAGGLEASIPSAALRATRLEIVGSGQGSVSTGAIVAELPTLAAEIAAGTFAVNARAVSLAAVGQAWADAPTSRERLVITP